MIETPTSPAPPPRDDAWLRLEVLYRTSRDDVYAYVFTLLHDRAAAEDVTALAFERAYRRRRTFDRRRGEERAWLFGIARNAALDELRRRRRFTVMLADPADPADPAGVAGVAGPDAGDVGEGCEPILRRAAVRTALAALPARERELIALKFHAGLRNAELARVLGVSESNAGTMLHRAIQKLRKACDEMV
ncbi:MAG: RNA polymerase sigma factor [Solirubrobacteraceae bacterium]